AFLLNDMGMAYKMIGEMERAENCFLRLLEFSEIIQNNKQIVLRARLNLFYISFAKLRHTELYHELQEFLKEKGYPDALYLLTTLDVIQGKLKRALRALNSLLVESGERKFFRMGILETKGLGERILGNCEEAMKNYLESIRGFLDFGAAYSVFPCAKAINLSRFSGLKPPSKDIVKRCLSLAKGGSWGEQAAADEIRALQLEDENEAAVRLFEAAKNYYRAYQPIEAFLAGLTSAFLAWRSDSPIFPLVLKFLSPLAPLHPGFKQDPFLGEFFQQIEPLITQSAKKEEWSGIKAYLIGETRVFVDGKEITLRAWHNNQAIRALVYLLLSPRHRIPLDHLFYLLWPRRKYNEKSRSLLYTAIKLVREHLGRRELLTKKGDFYQLEEVWTDVEEIENLMRLADVTREPAEKEEYLARARELASGELLPEFPYDRYIEEYRQYYERLRKRVFGEVS
ncbi:MAG: hypothetical protein ABIM88_07395, partial [candidate division WOR-3 bacterium]